MWARGFGFADLENRVPATPDTLYSIASLTKTFASTLVMRLVEQGKLAHVRVGNSIRFVSDLARSAGAPRGLYGPDSLRASPKKRK